MLGSALRTPPSPRPEYGQSGATPGLLRANSVRLGLHGTSAHPVVRGVVRGPFADEQGDQIWARVVGEGNSGSTAAGVPWFVSGSRKRGASRRCRHRRVGRRRAACCWLRRWTTRGRPRRRFGSNWSGDGRTTGGSEEERPVEQLAATGRCSGRTVSRCRRRWCR